MGPRRDTSCITGTQLLPKSMNGQILPSIIRFTNVPGYGQRCNNAVYCRPLDIVGKSNLCIFFGGDVQDFTENMVAHRDNKNHVQWNLENTAVLLQSSFVDNHIIVIRPDRMEYKTFSCFESFVPSSKCGVPEHAPMHNGLRHLQLFIENVANRLRTMKDEEFNEAVAVSKSGLVSGTNLPQNPRTPGDVPLRSTVNWDDCDITLVGFSKGCVVLNQFIHEFHYYKSLSTKNSDTLKMVSRIKNMYWLDGGHSGGKNTWVTSVPLLETVATMGIRVHVHVSPYQVADERRPWIKKEEKCFSDTLKSLGVQIHRVVHFNNVPSNLETHFNVLKVFKEAHVL